jgi:hypothetical protein
MYLQGHGSEAVIAERSVGVRHRTFSWTGVLRPPSEQGGTAQLDLKSNKRREISPGERNEIPLVCPLRPNVDSVWRCGNGSIDRISDQNKT